jgi:hypothetical protein
MFRSSSGEDGIPRLAGTTYVSVIEEADDVAGRVETLDDIAPGVEDLSMSIDLKSTKSESDPCGHRERGEWRAVYRIRPIGLGRYETVSSLPIANRRVKGCFIDARRVESSNSVL